MNFFIESGRIPQADRKIISDLDNEKLENYFFLRLIAKGRSFKNISFKYTIFDNCYLRKCRFHSCDFTGCKFIGSNLPGSVFQECIFDYTTFERTNITSDILDTECPGLENLKQFFARSLRINYQQIGDSTSVNKAIRVELQATNNHLYKEWNSNESYYRNKYKGLARIYSFFKWSQFKLLDFAWGNGESFVKMLRSVMLILFFISLVDWCIYSQNEISSSIYISPAIFLGIMHPKNYSPLYLSAIALIRLISVGFLISIIIKRFNRR